MGPRMVFAKNLLKSRWWRCERVLNQPMSMHFPHIGKPCRSTDICKHCKLFSTHVLPAAKRASDFEEIVFPKYFCRFDASLAARPRKKDQQAVEFVTLIEHSSANPLADKARMSLPHSLNKLSLAVFGAHAFFPQVGGGHVEFFIIWSQTYWTTMRKLQV